MVTLLPGATSLYVWQEKLVDTSEVQLLLKTDNAHQQDLIHLLKTSHPYVTPELLVIPLSMERVITCHGLPHHYVDPAVAGKHQQHSGTLFSNTPRQQFVPVNQAFASISARKTIN